MQKNYFLTLLLGLVLFLAACNKDTNFDYYYYSAEDYALLSQYLNLPETPHDFSLKSPALLETYNSTHPIPTWLRWGVCFFTIKTCPKTAPSPAAVATSRNSLSAITPP
ncbi:MAG: hypothetical protein IPJ82_15375 [Lewinellaceae bacterium]|nr:hypothetical protein [Lewinellaceae bacterium]